MIVLTWGDHRWLNLPSPPSLQKLFSGTIKEQDIAWCLQVDCTQEGLIPKVLIKVSKRRQDKHQRIRVWPRSCTKMWEYWFSWLGPEGVRFEMSHGSPKSGAWKLECVPEIGELVKPRGWKLSFPLPWYSWVWRPHRCNQDYFKLVSTRGTQWHQDNKWLPSRKQAVFTTCQDLVGKAEKEHSLFFCEHQDHTFSSLLVDSQVVLQCFLSRTDVECLIYCSLVAEQRPESSFLLAPRFGSKCWK